MNPTKNQIKMQKVRSKAKLKKQKMANKQMLKSQANAIKAGKANLKGQNKIVNSREIEKTKRTIARSTAVSTAASNIVNTSSQSMAELAKWNATIAASTNDGQSGNKDTTQYNPTGNPIYGGNQGNLGGGK